MRFETKAIHIGQEPDSSTGAVIVPVYQTSTYFQEAVGKHKGYEYSRTGNPTRTALEKVLASLENGRYGLAFASGLAASANIFHLFNQGDHVVAGDDLYGGTYRLLEKVIKKSGIRTTYADIGDIKNFEKALEKNTKLIWIESPTNPLLKVLDIKKLAKLAHDNKAILVVDNTFVSPFFQSPIDLGADIVLHSTTKYIGGHSDVVGGALITNNETLYNELKFFQNAAGAFPGPMDCWLTVRGIKTLALRMKAHEENALYILDFLLDHPKVSKVYYPSLYKGEEYSFIKEQMRGFGGMISFELKGDFNVVEKFFSGLKLFLLAESLGGVESLVSYPAKMTHASIPAEERLRRGITDNLVRLSVGIENKEDLLYDLRHAFDNI